MNKNYKKWLEKLKPYKDSCDACKRLCERLERKIPIADRLRRG